MNFQDDRKANFGITGEQQMKNQNAYYTTQGNQEQFKIPRQRNTQQQNNNEFMGNEDKAQPYSTYSKKPLLSEKYIDQQTNQLTKEIFNLDKTLEKNESNKHVGGSEVKQILPIRIRNGQQQQNQNVEEEEENIYSLNKTNNNNANNNTNTNNNNNQKYSVIMPAQKNSVILQSKAGEIKDIFDLREQQIKEKLIEKEKMEKEQQQKELQEKQRQEKLQRERKEQLNNLNLQQPQPLKLQQQNQQQKFETPVKQEPQIQIKQQQGQQGQLQNQKSNKKEETDEVFNTYVPNVLNNQSSQKNMVKTRNINGNNENDVAKFQKQHEEKVAVATGVQDQPFEDSQQLDQDLILCPEGCGRSFNEQSLQKHIQVCKKVFQSKRNEFNTQQHRIIDAEQAKIQRQAKMKEKIDQGKQKMDSTKQKDTEQQEKPWKEQSEQLKEQIKKAKNQKL